MTTKPRKTIKDVWPWIERCGDAPLFLRLIRYANTGRTESLTIVGDPKTIRRTQRNFYRLKDAIGDQRLDGVISTRLKDLTGQITELTFSIGERRETRGRRRKK